MMHCTPSFQVCCIRVGPRHEEGLCQGDSSTMYGNNEWRHTFVVVSVDVFKSTFCKETDNPAFS